MGAHPFTLLEAAGSLRPVQVFNEQGKTIHPIPDSPLSLLLSDLSSTEEVYRTELRRLLSCCQLITTRSKKYEEPATADSHNKQLQTIRGLLEQHDILEDILRCSDEVLCIVRFSEWVNTVVPYYSRYVMNYHYSVEQVQIEAQLKRRPLIRIRYFNKFVERVMAFVSGQNEPYAKELLEALGMAKHKLSIELADARKKDEVERRRADLNTITFNKVKDLTTFDVTASGFDLSHITHRQKSHLWMKHPRRTDNDVEVELLALAETNKLQTRKQSYSIDESTSVALCKVNQIGRTLMFPPFRKGELRVVGEDMFNFAPTHPDGQKIVLASTINPDIQLKLEIGQEGASKWLPFLNTFFAEDKENVDPSSSFAKDYQRMNKIARGKKGLEITATLASPVQQNVTDRRFTRSLADLPKPPIRVEPQLRKSSRLDSESFKQIESDLKEITKNQFLHPYNLAAQSQATKSAPSLQEKSPAKTQDTLDEDRPRKFDPESFGRVYEDAFMEVSEKKERRKSIFNLLGFSKRKTVDKTEEGSTQPAAQPTNLKNHSTTTLATTHTVTTLKADSKVDIESGSITSKNIKGLSIEKPPLRSHDGSALQSPFAITPVSESRVNLTNEEKLMVENGSQLCKHPARISRWNGSQWALFGRSELMCVVVLNGNAGMLLGYDIQEYNESDSPQPLMKLDFSSGMTVRRSTSLDIQIKTQDASTLIRAQNEYGTDTIFQSLEAYKRESRRSILLSTTKKSFSSSSSTQSFFSHSNSTASTSMTSIESGASYQSALQHIQESDSMSADIMVLGKPSMTAAKPPQIRGQSSPSIVSAISPLNDKFSGSSTSLASTSSRKRSLKERVFSNQPELLLFNSSFVNANGDPVLLRMSSFVALPNFFHLIVQGSKCNFDIVVSAKNFKKSTKTKVLLNTNDYGSKKPVDQVEFDMTLEFKNKKEGSSFAGLVLG